MMKDQSMMMGGAGGSQEDQMKLMMKAMVQQSRAQDKLFEKTGIEEEQLLYSIEKLNLE